MDLGRNLENYLNNYECSWPLGGTILAARDGDILFKEAYGYASIEHQVPNTVKSKYRIWSLTKSFTAMAVMMLYEQGFLRFDDSISMYLPELDHLNHITVFQLLNHTSGLINYTSLPEYNRQLNKLRLSRQEVLNLFKDIPLAFQPGTSFMYNNSGYFLLGMIIERISCMSFERYVQRNILEPLGMEDTGIDDNRKIIHGMSAPYDASGDGMIPCEFMDMSSSFSAGSMYSTVEDLYAWDQAWCSDKLVSYPTLKLALAGHEHAYGFGWFIDQKHRRQRIHHGGAYRGFRSELHRFPEDRMTLIMLSNYDFVPLAKLAESLTGVLFGEQCSVPSLPAVFPLNDDIYAKYMGTYEGFGCKAVVDRKDEALFFNWNDHTVVPFYPISETAFHHTWQDWSCTFECDMDGRITFLGMIKQAH